MTLTPLTLNLAPASEEVWKVHELPALFSWTYSALFTVKRNGIYTYLDLGTKKCVAVAPLHQCSELRVRKTTLQVLCHESVEVVKNPHPHRLRNHILWALVGRSLQFLKWNFFRLVRWWMKWKGNTCHHACSVVSTQTWRYYLILTLPYQTRHIKWQEEQTFSFF